MTLSIIIVSWNTRRLLQACLESVFAHPPDDNFEVWVVDNASTDGSPRLLREQFPLVHLIENEENLGFARANNQAITASTGEFVLLLNSDTEVKPGALQELITFLEGHPAAGAAGPKLLNPDGSLQPSCFPFPTLSRELWRLFHLDRIRAYGVYHMHQWDPAPREVDAIKGACLMLRRKATDQVGLLDDEYFMYTEEIDLCYRLRRSGWTLHWVPQASVVHHGGQSTRQVAENMFRNLYQSKLLFFRKRHGRLAGLAYKLVLLVSALARLLVSPLALLERPHQRRQHLKLASHYFRLIVDLPEM